MSNKIVFCHYCHKQFIETACHRIGDYFICIDCGQNESDEIVDHVFSLGWESMSHDEYIHSILDSWEDNDNEI